MAVVIVKPVETIRNGNGRPYHCPYCGSPILQRWGKADLVAGGQQEHNPALEVYRYRCSDCGRTFRHYPENYGKNMQSTAVRAVAGLAWELGLSMREIVEFLAELGIHLSRMTVWREVKRFLLNSHKTGRLTLKKYTLDKLYIQGASAKLGVVVMVDFGEDRRAILGAIDECNPWAVKAWLERIMTGSCVEISVGGTGKLKTYEVDLLMKTMAPCLEG